MRVFHVLTEGGELCRKKETWPMEEGDWVERLFFVHPSLQQLLATAVMRQIVCIMSAVAAPGVSGDSWGCSLPVVAATQTAEGAHLLLCMDCGRRRALKDKRIRIPPMSRPALLHQARAVVWEIAFWEYVI